MDFLKSLRRKLNSFNYNSFEILDGKGIIFLDSVANALASKHIAPCNNNLINKKDKI